jgi:hypothetical protein
VTTRWPRTVWRIRGIDFPGRFASLDVQLVVDTTAAEVIDAIETAAGLNGIQLERVDYNDELLEMEDVG